MENGLKEPQTETFMLEIQQQQQGMIRLGLIELTNDIWLTAETATVFAIWLSCWIVGKRHKGKIHEGGHGPVFVAEHPMGSSPFPSPKAGGNAIETWYAEGMDFCRNTIAIGSNSPTPPSVLYPISDMRHTGYTYPNRLDPGCGSN